MMKNVIWMMFLAVVIGLGSVAMAATIETVHVGNPGNPADTTGYGSVSDEYDIGMYEVTAGQYCEFLNAVAKTDTYVLYNGNMDSNSRGCQITQVGTSGDYTYDFSGRPSGEESDWVDRPVNYVSWGDAARFSNWLHNGQPTGAQDNSTTEDGAYNLNGATSNSALTAITREDDWKWANTSEDEWYKAAYYSGSGSTYYKYPTSTDTKPSNALVEPDPGNNATYDDTTIGSPYYRTEVGAHENSDSPYGTFDQGGNVWEWNETLTSGKYRGVRGSSFDDMAWYMNKAAPSSNFPANEYYYYGFRVSNVPEPATLSLLALGGLAVLRRRRKFRAIRP